MFEVIPKELDNILPFTVEPISNWSVNVDVLQFLYRLYDFESEIILRNGEKRKSSYRDYGKFVFDDGKENIYRLIEEFSKFARESKSDASEKSSNQKVDLLNDPMFGQTAKYIIAFDGVCRNILEDGGYYSVSHVLETETDLQCSLLLGSNLYFKHSYQVIRSFLENLILPIYFIGDLERFDAWRNSDFRMPPLRGKKGILREFIRNGTISKEFADKISRIYGELCMSVHGLEKQLIHTGIHDGNWEGQIFTQKKFQRWCITHSDILEISIYLLRIHVELWMRHFKELGIRCDICLNDDFVIIDDINFLNSQKYICKKCGREMTYRKNI